MIHVLIDCWAKPDSLANFKASRRNAYQALDTHCKQLTVSEQLLGIYDD